MQRQWWVLPHWRTWAHTPSATTGGNPALLPTHTHSRSHSSLGQDTTCSFPGAACPHNTALPWLLTKPFCMATLQWIQNQEYRCSRDTAVVTTLDATRIPEHH